MAGQEATAEGMSIRVTGVENVTTDAYHMHKGTFIAPTDGEYMIGFHDMSDAAERAYLYLADIIVSEAAPGGALFMETFFNDTIQGHSFKVSLKDAKAPKLSFKRSTENGYLIMQVIVYNADRTHVETVYEEDIPEPDGWKEVEVSLDAFVNEPRYICVAFSAIDPMMSNYYKYLNVTDIRIYDAAPTAITEVVSERDVDNTIYSIDGRVMGTSIENLPQGIYIQGGKKILK